MRYDPTKAEAMLPEGWYAAVICNAKEGKSKAGNDMLTVTFQIYWAGEKNFLTERFVTNNKGSLTRLRKLMEAIGLNFDHGEVTPSDMVQRDLQVQVKIQEGDGTWPDKNVAANFRNSNAPGTPAKAELPPGVPTGDDIPF